MNKWKKIKKYINSKEFGSVINRKDMRYYINGRYIKWAGEYSTGEDNYRRMLTLVGILEHVERGNYKIIYHIRNDATSTEVKQAAYSGWGQWFNDFKVKQISGD